MCRALPLLLMVDLKKVYTKMILAGSSLSRITPLEKESAEHLPPILACPGRLGGSPGQGKELCCLWLAAGLVSDSWGQPAPLQVYEGLVVQAPP
ncbi:hypothetical protein DSO57_1020032 [Entomophthora muscae]|uniref:Uncharacterized protein n=1 Tax=Entomophthora muscae TaxID=34485 RepID=A0ACC2RIK1_9FUNG|nr:hypothetical protein DSO57_1020032 [Entomophthora muscae]